MIDAKKFCFLIQARSDDDYFDTFRTEDSDCFVLTFNCRVHKENYIYAPKTSWSEGRNLLLKEAYGKKDYEYYVFMDDDARIVDKETGSCGISKFKELLLKHLPAVGFPDYYWHLNGTADRFGSPQRLGFLDSPHYYDACVNAFHKDCIQYILPYEVKYDKVSWWLSQEVMNYCTFFLLDNSVLQFNELLTINNESSDYPQERGVGILNDAYYKYAKYLVDFESVALYPENRVLSFSESYRTACEIKDELSLRFETLLSKDHCFYINNRSFWETV